MRPCRLNLRPWLWLGLVVIACQPANEPARGAPGAVESHMARFVHFEGWAERAALADPAMSSTRALEEALFAPLRQDGRIRGAWVTLSARPSARLVWPAAARFPEAVDWVRVRHARWGNLRVTEAAECPFSSDRGGDHAPESEASCVLVTRDQPRKANPAVEVTLAFAVDPTEP